MQMSGHPLSDLHLNKDFSTRSSLQLVVGTTVPTKDPDTLLVSGVFMHATASLITMKG